MRLFRKRQYWDGHGLRLSEKMVSTVMYWQRKWADDLNRRTRHISVKSWWIALILFCLVSLAYLLQLLITSIF